MNIVLIGARGTGKSAVGRLVSRKLGMSVFGTDACVVEKAGISIPEIVKKYGWEKFRDMESEVAGEAASQDNCIIDTGGGIVLLPQNIQRLKQNGIIIWLQAEVKKMAERIKDDRNRPPLTEQSSLIEEIEAVMKERTPKYQSSADYTIDTSNISVDEAAERVIEIYRQHKKNSI